MKRGSSDVSGFTEIRVVLTPQPTGWPPTRAVSGMREPGAVTSAIALVAAVERAIAGLQPRQFLTLDYDSGDPGNEPYSQIAVEPDGFYLEVESEHYLPGEQWPIDEAALRIRGWWPPDDQTANWWCTSSEARSAAKALVTALMVGRSCRDPERFSVSIGTFQPPPDGGQLLPDMHAGAIAA